MQHVHLRLKESVKNCQHKVVFQMAHNPKLSQAEAGGERVPLLIWLKSFGVDTVRSSGE